MPPLHGRGNASQSEGQEAVESINVSATEESAAAFGLGLGLSLPVSQAVELFVNADAKMNADYFGYQANIGGSFKFGGGAAAKKAFMNEAKPEPTKVESVEIETPKPKPLKVENLETAEMQEMPTERAAPIEEIEADEIEDAQ